MGWYWQKVGMVGGATVCDIIRKFAYKYHSFHVLIVVSLLGVVIVCLIE